MQNRRGVSTVVATVLIITITVAAIGIIRVAIMPMLKNSLTKGTDCKDIDITIDTYEGYTCYDSINNLTAVNVKKMQIAKVLPN